MRKGYYLALFLLLATVMMLFAAALGPLYLVQHTQNAAYLWLYLITIWIVIGITKLLEDILL